MNPSDSSPRALVVERDPEQRERARVVLEEFGIHAAFAASCAEAEGAVRAATIDYVLVALGQAEGGDPEVVAAVRGAGFQGPVIALAAELPGTTGYMDVMERFDACIVRPLCATSLIRVLRRMQR